MGALLFFLPDAGTCSPGLAGLFEVVCAAGAVAGGPAEATDFWANFCPAS